MQPASTHFYEQCVSGESREKAEVERITESNDTQTTGHLLALHITFLHSSLQLDLTTLIRNVRMTSIVSMLGREITDLSQAAYPSQ